MASTFTPNVQLEEPARGDDPGTWDTPVNANMTLLDLIAGGMTTISMAAGSVVLAAAQYKCKTITLNSTLAANATITFPTSFVKSYEVQNICTGSSFTITLTTTAAGGQVICCPPGEIIDVLNDGTNLKYRNLGRVGSYMDVAATAVPAWISGCTVPPYLNCLGGTYNSSVYPALFSFLGSSILPDSRGRVRAAMNGGTGRLSSGANSGGFNGDTLSAAGGNQALSQHSHGVTDPGHVHEITQAVFSAAGSDYQIPGPGGGGAFSASHLTGLTVNSAGAGDATGGNVQPTYMGGITMIRAA